MNSRHPHPWTNKSVAATPTSPPFSMLTDDFNLNPAINVGFHL
jgi:hypothetical protein